MKSLKLTLILSSITAMLCSCKEKKSSLIGLFWDPPPNIEVLYNYGAKKGEMANGSGYDQTALLTKKDTVLQCDYREQNLFYEYLQIKTSNAKVVFDSIVLKHHLQSGIGNRPNDTSANFIMYHLSDDKSNYHFTVRDTSIQIMRVWQ